MMLRGLKNKNSGFSLIQVGILLTVASLVLVATLPGYQTQLNSNKNCSTKLNTVMTALRKFQSSNGRIPCPADAGQLVGATYYGMEATNQYGNCAGGTTTAANLVDATNSVAIGMVPVRTLGLPNDAALDDYGRYITYAADTTATGCWASQSLQGKILIDNPDVGSSFTQNTVAALVSHGVDGHGAMMPAVTASTLNRLNSGSSDTDQGVNAHLSPGTFNLNTTTLMADSGTVNTMFVKKKPTATFSDIVVYGNNAWSLNTIPYSVTNAASLSTYPANGTYSSGSLTFKLVFPQQVTVTGTPRLAVKPIINSSNTTGTLTGNGGYALYQSGTGTNTLTFTYTIVSGDKAPLGISVSSPLDMNSSSAFINPCFTFFTPPDLSGVIISQQAYLYVADGSNHRVVVVNMSAIVQATFNKAATGAATLDFVYGVVVDNAGNTYVADGTNSRIVMYPSGSTAATLGTVLAQPSTSFTTPKALAYDSVHNYLWVGDARGINSRLIKYDIGAGTWDNTNVITLAGKPYGAVLDAAGANIWVSLPGNGCAGSPTTLQKCSLTSFTCIAIVTSCGSGSGKMASNASDSDDLASTTISSVNYIFVTDESNSRIQAWPASTSTSGTTPAYTMNLSASTPSVTGLAFDASGWLWVANEGTNALHQRWATSGTGILGPNSPNPITASLSSPQQIFYYAR